MLGEHGVKARVVSMPSWELFDAAGRRATGSAVLGPAGTPRVAVEAGVTIGWERYVGERGAVVGIDRYGASGPGAEVLEHFGFTPEHVAATALRVLGRTSCHREPSIDRLRRERRWLASGSPSGQGNRSHLAMTHRRTESKEHLSTDQHQRGRASGRTTSPATCSTRARSHAIEEIGIRGLTSNPTIFEKAIAGGTAYDEQIAGLLGAT